MERKLIPYLILVISGRLRDSNRYLGKLIYNVLWMIQSSLYAGRLGKVRILSFIVLNQIFVHNYHMR